MKKLMIAMSVALLGVTAARAEFIWSWWAKASPEVAKKDVQGCVLGIASETASIKGAQVSLFFNVTGEVKSGAQVAIGCNRAKTVMNGPQVSYVNIAEEGAALQFGLLNFNKSGFLPWFPFFNFSPKFFGGNK